jgi:hypothetical protein
VNEKPHKGKIENWHTYPVPHGLGYMVIGTFVDHPQFKGLRGHTSYIVAHDEDSGEIETKNSRYKLVGDPE